MTPPSPGDEQIGLLRVRPYALTGGRTRASVQLEIETLVRTTERGWSMRDEVTPIERSILEHAGEATSIAEIAAHLGVVLGAVRVIVGDMVAAGRLDRSNASAGGPDASLLERVLDGLQQL